MSSNLRSELDKAVTAIGGNAAALQGDTTNLADLDRIYATVKAQAGHIDVLAANAGVYEFATLGEITEEHFDRTFNTNVRGLLFAVQKALPLLTKGSSVILTGSMVSIKGFPSCSVYNASKAAIRSFARGWIVDLKGRDIRVKSGLLQVVDPDTAIRIIRNLADTVPITHFYSWTLPPGLPPRWAQTHLELFASKVIPAFR
jgi:NAD(P)-dependent dehydrogenase (short-subunit alcohol dehydrogenase family)